MRYQEKHFHGKNNELLSFSFGEKDRSPYFCTPFDGAYALPDSIMVVQLILVQFVLVRIQVGQQSPLQLRGASYWLSCPEACGFLPPIFFDPRSE
jgi:hypothetical protein